MTWILKNWHVGYRETRVSKIIRIWCESRDSLYFPLIENVLFTNYGVFRSLLPRSGDRWKSSANVFIEFCELLFIHSVALKNVAYGRTRLVTLISPDCCGVKQSRIYIWCLSPRWTERFIRKIRDSGNEMKSSEKIRIFADGSSFHCNARSFFFNQRAK